jgi:cell division protein FtsI (penicillin-binding protein 3)
VFAPTTAREVRKMLEMVVAPGGTSPDAHVPGYRVGGKSGTAYKHVGRGYDRSKYRASFVGMAPMPNPRIVVAVSVDEPTVGGHFGGQVSGPVFSSIVGDTLRTLNVPPDMPVKQLVVSGDSPEAASAAAAPKTVAAPVKRAAAAKPITVADEAKNRIGVVR